MRRGRVLLVLLALAARLAAKDVTVMNPLVVEASHADWRLLSAPGFEVLSRGPRAQTSWFASGVFLSRMREQELPDGDLFPDLPAPATVILYSTPPEAAGALVPPPTQQAPAAERFWGGAEAPLEITGAVPGEDDDTITYAVNVWNLETTGTLQGYYGMTKRMERLTPPLPPWFAAALLGPFGINRSVPVRDGWLHPGMLWVTPEETDQAFAALERHQVSNAAKANAAAPPDVVPLAPLIVKAGARLVLLPMQEFFRERPAGEEPPALWSAQAGLFARWGCYARMRDRAENERHLQAFGRLVEIGRTRPVTEAIVQECFGFGYATLRQHLTNYLHAAASEAIVTPFVHVDRWPRGAPDYVDHRATDGDVARLIADWERMTGEGLRARWPILASNYFTEAEKLLHRVWAMGNRDPRLLAVYGMLEADVGKWPAADDFLQTAVTQNVTRPAAYLTLARLRLAEAEVHPAAKDRKLSREQLRPVRVLVAGARRNGTLPGWTYRFWIRALSESEADPPNQSADLALLAEGVAHYPRAVNLATSAAELSRSWGRAQEAEQFEQAALVFAPSP